MFWEPIDFEDNLPSLGKGSSFYLQPISDKYLLFIYEGEFTFLLVLQHEGNRLSMNCVKKIPSKHSISRITGNSNAVLMLDVKEELFYLQGTVGNKTDIFDQNNGNKFLTSDGILSWQRLHQLTNCLAMSGVTNGILFLYHNVSVYAAHYRTVEIKAGLHEISNKKLKNFDIGAKYFIAKLNSEMAKIFDEKVLKTLVTPKEVLLVIEQSKMYFIIPIPDGQIVSQPYSIDVQTDLVINVLCFQKKGCILIICKSGKIVCLRFSDFCKSFQSVHVWLPKAVTCITGYEDDIIYLLWSNHNNFYMSGLGDGNVITNIHVPQNIRGVKHFVKIDDNIMAITINGCLYEAKIRSVPDQKLKYSSQFLLNKMFQTAKDMEKMTEEVAVKEVLMDAFHLSRVPNISKKICVIERDGLIVLQNKTEYLFKKEFWKLLIEKEDSHRRHVEMKELENDINPGSCISFKYSEKMINGVTLFCDITDSVIVIELEVKSEGNNSEVENQLLGIQQFLKEKCTFIA